MDQLTEHQIVNSVKSYNPELELSGFKDISGRARRTYLLELENSNNLVGYYCSKEGNEEKFKKEEGLLETLNEKTGIPTQKIIHSDLSKNKIPYLFYLAHEIQGFDPESRYKYMPRGFKRKYVMQVARNLAELHNNVQFDEAGEFRLRDGEIKVLNGGSWREFLEQKVMERINDFDERFSDLEKPAEEFLKKNLDMLGGEQPCLVHYDVKPDNTIVKDGELEAIVDWEKSICGDRIWDLAYSRFHLIDRWFETESIRNRLEEQFLQAYIEESNLRKDWRKRLKYYGILQIFDGMHDFSNFTEAKGMTDEEKNKMENSMRESFQQNDEKIEEAKNEFAV
jgi:aminoglycoside phosphotransferase (APT) family kinase protein